jgi:hypothetical protein
VLRVTRAVVGQACHQIGAQLLEAEPTALDRTLPDVEDAVYGDAIDPRLQAAAEVELREPRHDADQDLLRGILGVFRDSGVVMWSDAHGGAS